MKLSKTIRKLSKEIERFLTQIFLKRFATRFTLEELGACSLHSAYRCIEEPGEHAHGITKFWYAGEDIIEGDYQSTFKSPGVYIAKFKNSVAIGRSELVLKDKRAYYYAPFDPVEYTFMLELEGRAFVWTDLHVIAFRFKGWPQKSKIKLDKAISLLGECNRNYAHWVLEVLTRVVIANTEPDLDDLPLLVDTEIHPKMRSALDLINTSRRKIIEVKPSERVSVGCLIKISSPSFTPPETRKYFSTKSISTPRNDQYQFSPHQLVSLRAETLKQAKRFNARDTEIIFAASHEISPKKEIESAIQPSRIYLAREAVTTANLRCVKNQDSVKLRLKHRGYWVLDIAGLDFENQVLALQDAKVVVAPIGAACINLLFCEPGVSVILLSPTYKNANWYYWVNLISAMGHRLHIILGNYETISGIYGVGYHGNYWVDLQLLEQIIESVEAGL